MIELLAQNYVLRGLLLAFLFAIVAAAAYFAAEVVALRQQTRRRLLEGSPRGGVSTMHSSLRSERVENAWLKLVNAIENRGLSLVDTKDASVRQKLVAAGYTATYAPRVYTLVRLLLVVGLPSLVLLFMWLTGSSPSVTKLYFSLIVAAAMGLYLPSLFVRGRADRRQRELINGFPDALD